MTIFKTRPEDILPDDINTKSIDGISVRKGTVAAFLANIEQFERATTAEEKGIAKKMLVDLAPAIHVIGLHERVIFKNKEVEQILVDAALGTH
jgi:hypothetical protein